MSTYPLFIDNIAFAKKNERLAGSLTLANCPRLSELSQANPSENSIEENPAAVVDYLLEGTTDSVGQNLLHLSLTTNLTTTCQRCLGPMPLKMKLDFNYLITDIDDTDVEDSDDIDLQEPSQNMDLIALIEDEIIMAMPIAPIHEEDCGAIVTQSGEKPNPFAVLKGLIKP
ncbi:MAG TPA: YceD family protein [Methylotenera sp.]|nr:YceD family protein [Methylotenera sp.]